MSIGVLSSLEEISGVASADRITNGQPYAVVCKEMVASAIPGMLHKQAPRMLISMIAALENLVADAGTHPYLRIFSWWLLVQNWGTSAITEVFCFHMQGFAASITRSKTTGADREVQSRPVVIDAICFLTVPDWMTQGWKLLASIADFKRDYLMASSNNYQSCLRRELRYDTAFALQHKVLSLLKIDGEKPFQLFMSKFWTPHLGRIFCQVPPRHLVWTRQGETTSVAGRPKEVTPMPERRSDASLICKN